MADKMTAFLKSKINQNITFNSSASSCELVVKELARDDGAPIASRVIRLRVKLDSWSPEYKTPWKTTYKEKLSPSIFDDQGPIESLSLNSYVDHEISITHMIGSTSNNTMKVKREENEIIADIVVDESDPLSKKVANLISSGAVKSNSFIFKALDVKSEEKEDGNLEIIFTKGELISIDPVYAGFYPQNNSEVIETKSKLINEELEQRKEPIEMENKVVEKVSEQFEDISAVKDEADEIKKIEELVNLRSQETKDELTSTIKREIQSLNQNSVKKAVTPLKDIKHKWLGGATLSADETNSLIQEFDSLPEARQKEVAMILTQSENPSIAHVRNQLQSRKLDGTSQANGLVLIEVLNDPNVLSEMQIVFPELTSLAQLIPLSNLNEVKKSILIPDSKVATILAEGADSEQMDNKTTKVMFKPTRYSLWIPQNNQLNMFDAMLVEQTKTMRNSIFRALRKSYYAGLLKNVSQDLNLDTYDGGATKEAVVEAVSAKGIDWVDLEKVHKELIDMWGDSVTSEYGIFMHISTLTALEDIYFNKPTPLIEKIYDPINMTYRGIKIYASSYYPEELGASKHVVTFNLKRAIVAYGLTFVTIDDSITGISQDMHKRFHRTRGEIKMCDPNLNTRVIKVSATTTARTSSEKNK